MLNLNMHRVAASGISHHFVLEVSLKFVVILGNEECCRNCENRLDWKRCQERYGRYLGCVTCKEG